jgi:hypothetical protein
VTQARRCRTSRRSCLSEARVVARAHEHAAHDVGRRHALGALDHLEAPHLLGVRVRVGAVGQQARVVAVDHAVDLVLREQLFQEFRRQVVWDAWRKWGVDR